MAIGIQSRRSPGACFHSKPEGIKDYDRAPRTDLASHTQGEGSDRAATKNWESAQQFHHCVRGHKDP